MADTTTTANDIKPNTPPSTSATEEGPKPNGDSLSQTSSGLPPITKEAMSTTGAPLVPTNPLSQAKVPTPPPEPANEPVAPSGDKSDETSAPQSELKDKVDTDDTPAQQPEKSVEPAATDVAPSVEDNSAADTTSTAAPEAPKPVTVQDVQDEAESTSVPTETTPAQVAEKPADAPVTDEPTQQIPATAVVPETSEVPKTEAEAGDKRKADESEVVNGAADDSDEKSQDEPAEKKLKTNNEAAPAAPKKVGRPKKDKTVEKKKAPAPIGKTARRTRSQAALAGESL